MTRFAVLLRGVNVGKGNRVPMADFKAMLQDLGYRDVRTLLNSGNAVFASTGRAGGARHSAAIAAALEVRFGFTVATIVKSTAEVTAIVQGNPMVPVEADHSRFLVAFAQDAAGLASLHGLQALIEKPERLAVTGDAGYLYCANGILESKAGAALLGKAGRGLTTRNWATVVKLLALLREDATT